MAISATDARFCERVGADPRSFMSELQTTYALSRRMIQGMLRGEYDEIFGLCVKARQISWCPSLTPDVVEQFSDLKWDGAGLMTQAWYTDEWFKAHQGQSWSWSRARQLLNEPLNELMNRTRAEDLPARFISARKDLTPEFVAEHKDFPWNKSIMPLRAFIEPTMDCDDCSSCRRLKKQTIDIAKLVHAARDQDMLRLRLDMYKRAHRNARADSVARLLSGPENEPS